MSISHIKCYSEKLYGVVGTLIILKKGGTNSNQNIKKNMVLLLVKF
jgi:hypothetical protein